MPNFFYLSGSPGWCLDQYGKDQNDGYVQLHKGYGLTETKCLEKCKKKWGATDITGCEYHPKSCIYHSMPLSKGSGDVPFVCWIFLPLGISHKWLWC